MSLLNLVSCILYLVSCTPVIQTEPCYTGISNRTVYIEPESLASLPSEACNPTISNILERDPDPTPVIFNGPQLYVQLDHSNHRADKFPAAEIHSFWIRFQFRYLRGSCR